MAFLNFLFTKTFLKQLLYAVLALVVLSFFILWWLRITTNHNQKIEVPNLSKMSLESADDALDELDLQYVIMDSANYNPDFPPYSVIEQVPKAGRFVKENRKIYISLNRSEYQKITVPEVLGKTKRQAEPTLLAMGFKIGKVTKRPHISDHVLDMRYQGKKLKPGDRIQRTSVIDLIVGDGSLNRVQSRIEGGDGDGSANEDGDGN